MGCWDCKLTRGERRRGGGGGKLGASSPSGGLSGAGCQGGRLAHPKPGVSPLTIASDGRLRQSDGQQSMHSRPALLQEHVERGSAEHLAKRLHSQQRDACAGGSALRRFLGRGLAVASSWLLGRERPLLLLVVFVREGKRSTAFRTNSPVASTRDGNIGNGKKCNNDDNGDFDGVCPL